MDKEETSLFSATNKTYKEMLPTLIYIFILIVFIAFLFNIQPYWDYSELFSLFTWIGEKAIIPCLFLSVIFTIFLHKPLKRAFILSGWIILGCLLFFFTIGITARISSVIMQIPLQILLTTLLFMFLGFILRPYFSISSKIIKIILLIVPFLIWFIILGVIINTSSLSLSVCDKMPEQSYTFGVFIAGKQSQCYLEECQRNNDLLACSKTNDLGNGRQQTIKVATNLASSGKLNPADCEQLSNESKKMCYWAVAQALGDTTYCDKVGKIGVKDSAGGAWDVNWCYSLVAEQKKDPSTCNSIENEFERAECLNKIAISENDPSVCKTITQTNYRDDCYLSTAVQNHDSSGCVNIIDSSVKEMCMHNSKE